MRHQVQAAMSAIVQRNIARDLQPVPVILQRARDLQRRGLTMHQLAKPQAEPDTIEQALARARAAGF